MGRTANELFTSINLKLKRIESLSKQYNYLDYNRVNLILTISSIFDEIEDLKGGISSDTLLREVDSLVKATHARFKEHIRQDLL
jgi:hypothetical protein